MVARPIAPPTPREQLAPAVGTFLCHLETERGSSANTVAAYRNDLTRAVDYLADHGVHGWRAVKPLHLAALAAHFEARGDGLATRVRRTAVLRTFFRWLAATGIVEANTAAEWRAPSHKLDPPRALTADQMRAMLRTPGLAAGPCALRDAALVAVLVGTGARISEVVGMDEGDANPVAGYAHLGAHDREVPLPANACEALARYLAGPRLQLERMARRSAPTTALFLNHMGGRLSRQGAWLILREVAAKVGVPDATARAIRHGLAVDLLRNHASMADVQQVLGHANVDITRYRYRGLVTT